jgi:hypothetical protein
MGTANIFLGVALATLIVVPAGAEGSATGTQVLTGTELDLGDGEFLSAVTAAADVSTGAAETIGFNAEQGDFNLQDNAVSLTFTSETAQSASQQSLLGQSFNKDSAPANSMMRNTVSADIVAPDGVSGTVGVNAAAGAFNVQKNAALIAVMPGIMLAQSFSSIGQDAALNLSRHHDVINDVAAIITLDSVTGNLGINLASGVGNVQLNSATTALSF